jgi:hypothetical protein
MEPRRPCTKAQLSLRGSSGRHAAPNVDPLASSPQTRRKLYSARHDGYEFARVDRVEHCALCLKAHNSILF